MYKKYQTHDNFIKKENKPFALKILTAALILTAMAAAFALTGCAQENQSVTIEKFIAQNPDIDAQIDDSLAEIDYKGATVSVDYEGDKILITYDYDDTFSKSEIVQMSEAYEKNAEEMDTICNNMLETLTEGTTFDSPSAEVRFINGDGTIMWSKEYTNIK